MSEVKRIETDKRRSRAVVYNGVVYVGGMTADDRNLDIGGKTEQALARVEAAVGKETIYE